MPQLRPADTACGAPRRRRAPRHAAGRFLRAVLSGLGVLAATAAQAAGCDLAWQLVPRLDAVPRRLEVSLTLAQVPPRTQLRLPVGWRAAMPLDDVTRNALQPVSGDPALRRIEATAGADGLTLRWQLPAVAGDAAVRLEAGWLAVLGQAVLPVPEGAADAPADAAASPKTLCVAIDGLPAASRFVGSAGGGQGERWQWQFNGIAQAQLAVFAAGALPTLNRQADGQALTVAVPEGAGLAAEPERLADAAAEIASQQRRFWRDADAQPPLSVLVLPAPPGSTPEAAAFGNSLSAALWLQWPVDLPASDSRLAAALTEALLRRRFPERLGPVVTIGRRDEALRAWLTEGLVAFYTHRQLLRAGAWTIDDYAAELNRRIERYLASPALAADNLRVATGWMSDPALAALPAARGEWLMLRWHQRLRDAGTPGLDALLRPLMLPAAQARREGPLSAPLGLHRMLAALRHRLGDEAQRETQQWIDRGQPFGFDADTLGPCFRMSRVPLADWRLGFDRASLASGVLRGVEPDGPAAAAGLRDGQRLVGHSLLVGDSQQPVVLQLRSDDGSLNTVRYLPAGTPRGERPLYSPITDALKDAACQGWLQGDAPPPGGARRGTVAGSDDTGAGAARMKCTPVRKSAKSARGHGAQSMKCVPVKGLAGKPGKGGKATTGKAGAKGSKASKAAAGTQGGKAAKAKSRHA